MDKNTILSQISQVDIYNFYYGTGFKPFEKISSPFSEDKNPSFKVFKNLSFKCFSTGKQGDVWQFVADIKGLDCKTQFTEVLATITADLGIIQQQKNITHHTPITDDDEKHFLYVEKPFTTEHYNFWLQGNWNVSAQVLDRYNV